MSGVVRAHGIEIAAGRYPEIHHTSSYTLLVLAYEVRDQKCLVSAHYTSPQQCNFPLVVWLSRPTPYISVSVSGAM
eukprot:scaffold14562_cov100-Skeletonema_dohrnii-CCMP3373.AAC.1